MVTHKNDVVQFDVTGIIQRGRILKFAIYAIYEDESRYRVALHMEDCVNREMFEFHHKQMIDLYTDWS